MKLGIDIGTHIARAAYLDTTGKPQLVYLPDGSDGLPAMARQTIQGLEVGPGVSRALAGNAETTVYGCTRLMGWAGDIPVQLLDRLPYPVREASGEAVCNLLYAEVQASDIYGILVRTLVDMATQMLGETVDEIVLTTPASAEDRFRVQARAAVEAQGLKVRRLVNQPAAALLAMTLPDSVKSVAIINCGSGSTEVSIAEYHKADTRILATAGDMLLGGDDFAWTVTEQLNQRFHQTDGIDIFAIDDSRLAAMGLWITVKEALQILSQGESETDLILDHGGGFGHDLMTTIQHKDVAKWLEPQLTRLEELCQQALTNSKKQIKKIDAVLMVGDWASLPAIQQRVTQFFKQPVITQDPALLPVYGAALATSDKARMVRDITPYALGINCYYNDVELFSPIVKANTIIPTPEIGHEEAFTENYITRHPDQTEVKLDILQYRGSRNPNPRGKKPVRPNECEVLGSWRFTGLKPPPGKEAAFTVTFAIDLDGILHLQAEETATGHRLTAKVTRGLF
jgi:molecular chaperone DnaK